MSFALEVDGDANAPVVTVLVQPERVDVGQTAAVTVLALDDAAVAGRQLTIAGLPVALDASHQAVYTATAPGAVPIVATAVDPSGNLGMATGALAVRDAADVTPPVVAIDTPAEDAELPSWPASPAPPATRTSTAGRWPASSPARAAGPSSRQATLRSPRARSACSTRRSSRTASTSCACAPRT